MKMTNISALSLKSKLKIFKEEITELGNLNGHQTGVWELHTIFWTSKREIHLTIDFSLSASLYPPRSSLPQRQRSSPSLAASVMIRTVGSVPSSAEPPSLPSMRPVSSVPKPRHLTTQVPAPPRIRTGVPPYSATLQSQRMETKAVQPRFMAAAVRIRSVVPVCSTPPPRKLSISSQELALHNQDKKDTIPRDVPTASSELGFLLVFAVQLQTVSGHPLMLQIK